MNYVKAALDWIKANPISLACMIVAILALGSFVYPTRAWNSKFRQELAARSGDLSKIKGLKGSQISVPPEQPDGEPQQITGVITEADAKALEKIFDRINKEYQQVESFVMEFNSKGRKPMRSDLFPEPRVNRQEGAYSYRDEIMRLYGSLDAGDALTPEKIQELTSVYERQFMNRTVPAMTAQELSDPVNRTTANEFIAVRLQNDYKQRALDNHIYARRVELSYEGANAPWEPGPFHVDGWVQSAPSTRVTLGDLWEGQIQLWIQQDLVDALRIANHIGIEDSRLTDAEKPCVINQPVKVLEQIEIVQSYVGLGSTASRGRSGPAAPAGMGGPGQESAPTPLTDSDVETAMKEGVPADFSFSPTGRKCNPLYDVHHARMVVIADYNRLPELFNAFRQSNFITVIGLTMDDVNEYEEFRNGYYFGDGVDAVRLDMTLEIVYLRQWTAGHNSKELAEKMGEPFFAGYMPDPVRLSYLLPPRKPEVLNQKVMQEEARTVGGATGVRGQRQPGGMRPPTGRRPPTGTGIPFGP